jgi:hypothetical protein
MNANQIAQLIGLTTQAYVNHQITGKECSDLTAILFQTAKDLGLNAETQEALRQFRILNYEAPANG